MPGLILKSPYIKCGGKGGGGGGYLRYIGTRDGVELVPDLRQLVQGDHQAAQDRLFLDGLRQRGGRSVCVNGVLHGHAGDGGAAVDHRASGLGGLFRVFAHVSGTSLKMAGAARFSATPAK